MHKSWYIATTFGFDGDAIAVATHGDQAILQIFGKARRADHLAKLVTHALIGGADLSADLVKIARGAVSDFIIAQNGVVDLGFHTWQRGELTGDALENRRLMVFTLTLFEQDASCNACTAKAGGNIEQGARREGCAFLGKRKPWANIGKGGERIAPRKLHNGASFLGLGKGARHLRKIGRRGEGTAFISPQRGEGIGRKLLQNFGQFQNAKGTILIHGETPFDHSTPRCQCPLVVF